MKQITCKIGNIPALLIGEESDHIYFFIHGKNGQKEEALAFAETVCPNGWQVLSIDLPRHGGRREEEKPFEPWEVIPELRDVLVFLKARWQHIALRATSIGAWFSLLAFQEESFENALFVSPVLDMERLILDMMGWATVTLEQLEREKEIRTDFGETLSWAYWQYVQAHPVRKWGTDTHILCARRDNLVRRETIDAFADRFPADVTVMENGEHWFHTEEQLAFLRAWEEQYVGRFFIRSMTPADYDGKAYVHYQSWQETYTGRMDSRILEAHTKDHCRTVTEQHPENTLVLMDRRAGNKVAGFICYLPQARPFVSVEDASEITGLYLLREYQGRGLGRKLLEACLEKLPRPNAALFVLENSGRAIGFYQHSGFRFTGRRHVDEINGGTAVVLEMRLDISGWRGGLPA